MKYEEDLYPPEEPNAGRIAVSIIIVVAVIFFLAWCAASMQAMASDTCPAELQEVRITEKVSPNDHVWKFEGVGLVTFMGSLRDYGLLVGIISNVDTVYVAETGESKKFFVFFLSQGCIVDKRRAPASVMERILPK
jgi:hypothetical protein